MMTMIEYVEDDFPLPSFDEVFNDDVGLNKLNTKKQIAPSSSTEIYRSLQFQQQQQHHQQSGINKSSSTLVKKAQSTSSSAGRWTTEEHQLFLQGVQLFGREWKKMQPLIKTRSIVQIRTHAQKVFKKDILNIRTRLAATATGLDDEV